MFGPQLLCQSPPKLYSLARFYSRATTLSLGRPSTNYFLLLNVFLIIYRNTSPKETGIPLVQLEFLVVYTKRDVRAAECLYKLAFALNCDSCLPPFFSLHRRVTVIRRGKVFPKPFPFFFCHNDRVGRIVNVSSKCSGCTTCVNAST